MVVSTEILLSVVSVLALAKVNQRRLLEEVGFEVAIFGAVLPVAQVGVAKLAAE